MFVSLLIPGRHSCAESPKRLVDVIIIYDMLGNPLYGQRHPAIAVGNPNKSNLLTKGSFTPRTITICLSMPTHDIVLFIISTHCSFVSFTPAQSVDSDWLSVILSFISWKKVFWKCVIVIVVVLSVSMVVFSSLKVIPTLLIPLYQYCYSCSVDVFYLKIRNIINN